MTLHLAQACPQSVQKSAVRRWTSGLHCPCPSPVSHSTRRPVTGLSAGGSATAAPSGMHCGRCLPPDCLHCRLQQEPRLLSPVAPNTPVEARSRPDAPPSSQSAAASSAWSRAELLRQPLGRSRQESPPHRTPRQPRAAHGSLGSLRRQRDPVQTRRPSLDGSSQVCASGLSLGLGVAGAADRPRLITASSDDRLPPRIQDCSWLWRQAQGEGSPEDGRKDKAGGLLGGDASLSLPGQC